MKQTYSILVSLILLLAACQAAPPSPTPATNTAAPIAQTTQTATLAPATTTPTSTPVPPVATFTPSHTPLPTYTFIPTLPSPTHTPTVTPTTPPTTPLLAPPPGYLAFLWNPEPFETNQPVLTRNLYFAQPGTTFAEWNIQPVLTDLASASLYPSPDLQKMAIAQFEDTNGDGTAYSISGTDLANIYLYAPLTGSFTRLTNNQIKDIPDVSWLPDNQTFTYALYKDIFQVNIVDSSVQPLLSMQGFIHYHTWSPNGRWLAIFSSVSDEPVQSVESVRLDIYDKETGTVIPIVERIGQGVLRWSPDSQYLAFTQYIGSGLFILNVNNLTISEIVSRDYLTSIAWSPDSHWLAFSQTHTNDLTNSNLFLWDTTNQSITQLTINGGRMEQPVWSPDGDAFAVTRFNGDKIELIVIEPDTNQPLTLFTSTTPPSENTSIWDAMPRVNWLPDSQWLFFIAIQDGLTGLFVGNQDNGQVYLVQDISNTSAPYILGWLP